MGIQHLNAYFKKNARSESIKKMHFKALANKVIAIDASIYLYRFLAEDSLLENIYFMVALMKHYGIIPIFVFDGKAPLEKHKLLEKRNQDKNAAEKKYNELSETLANIQNEQSKIELEEYIYNLKRKFVRLKWTDVCVVQQLLTAFGVTYIVADGEADGLLHGTTVSHGAGVLSAVARIDDHDPLALGIYRERWWCGLGTGKSARRKIVAAGAPRPVWSPLWLCRGRRPTTPHADGDGN